MRSLGKTTWAVLFALFALAPALSPAAENITLDRFLDKMTNLDWLYSRPEPGEKQVQFSSYDRKSKIENGKKIDWFANADSGNYLAEEQKTGGSEYVLADFKGPGVVTRIWSANPGKDRWRVYLDGSDTPVIDEPGETLLGGKGKNFKAPFAGKRNMGYLLLFPIPFAKSCKVTFFTTAAKKPSRYYHVDIVSLPGEAEVQTFKLQDLQTYKAKIDEVAKAMVARSPSFPDAQEISFDLQLQPGEEKNLAEISGPGVVATLELQVPDQPQKAVTDFLNLGVLSGSFDDLSKLAIYAPLGAFFGSAPGLNPYRSIASGMAYDKNTRTSILKSFWPMPFQKFARFSLANNTQKPFRVTGKFLVEKKSPGANPLYFHTTYHYLANHPTRPFVDWPLLEASGGDGRYVGTMLSVRNPDYAWWGEGDEKVYVDGEQFPSIFGTGTEDYFSYAWGARYMKFSHADYGMSLPTSKGMLILLAPYQSFPYRIVMTNEKLEEICSQYRWHIIDQVPFHKSMEFDLELWHWTPDITFDVQAVSYWYGDARISYSTQALDPKEIPKWAK